MRDRLKALYGDTLFKNSFFLMLNTATQAALGFVFWIICAHLFTPAEIGIGTALISAMSLISFASALGLNNTFTRFLPTSTDRDNEISTGVILVIIATIVVASGYILIVPFTTPALAVVGRNVWYAAGFVILVALAAINLLTDSIFIAYRGAKYALITDGGIQGVIKMLLPFAFAGLGSYGVFLATGSAASIAMVASIWFLIAVFRYRPKLKIDGAVVKRIFHYSFANYLGDLFHIVPTLVLPLIIINRLGAAQQGYYYLALSVATLLYAIASSVSSSLFAEGSYGDTALHELIKKAALIMAAIMLPATGLLAWLGPYVLQVFGSSYRAGGANVIALLALTAPPIAGYAVAGAILRIKNQLYSIVAVNVIYAAAVIGFAAAWASRGLSWVAFAWLVGNLIAAIVSFAFIYAKHGSAIFKKQTA